MHSELLICHVANACFGISQCFHELIHLFDFFADGRRTLRYTSRPDLIYSYTEKSTTHKEL